jgi:type VI secretion system protein ImpA
MIDVDALLKPIAGEKPCGKDFTYHPLFQNLETISRGKPETQSFGSSTEISPAEEPEWLEVRNAAIEVLGQSKHLAAGVILSLSLLKIGGPEGLRDGLAVMHGLTEKYWGDVYPKLDPEDNNDPTERLSILNSLASGRFIIHLKQVVLCDSPAMGRITLQQFITAKDKGGASDSDLKQIQAAFRDAGPDAAKARLVLVDEAIGHTKGIESFLDSILPAGQGVNFESLNKLLGQMKQALQPYAVSDTPAGDTSGGGAGQPATKSGPGMSGAIQTRGDVIKALDLICDYYRENEPSSPVPLILQRAQRLVNKDFMTIMTDLTPDALKQLQVITGTKPKD